MTTNTTESASSSSRGESILLKWGEMTASMAKQDAQVIDLLVGGPMTEADLVAKAERPLSGWTWRRLSTGVHKGEVRGPALIERVKVDGLKMWALTEAGQDNQLSMF